MNDHMICAVILWEQAVRAKRAELRAAALQAELDKLKSDKKSSTLRKVPDAN